MPHRKSAKPASTRIATGTEVEVPSALKKRVSRNDATTMTATEEERRPLVNSGATPPSPTAEMAPTSWASRNQWIVLALASGGCAAFNGVFAKLTTTELTTSLSQGLARLLGLSAFEGGIELGVRGTFFGLNLFFNGVMWALFTKALTRGHSTTQVSIINTSANFVITAILGFAIFSEALPPLWWAGAAMLVAGNVIIGRKVEGNSQEIEGDGESPGSQAEDGQGTYQPIPLTDGESPAPKHDEDVLELELDEELDEE
ncbi:hypothetical protein QBC47DRAFT_393040 [Echria macrotheca]|uniref:EamA domain-containing protein n=1 Tax=Echria macrotheca TaxID=438768 RepID=A0AAJ0B3N3_9PEZI|nr:hypothetical protein QBC47DRAFT_393040 [Echria macrotheca]